MKYLTYIKVLLVAAALTLSLPTLAINLQQAMSALSEVKKQGLVGEQANGYLGLVTPDAHAEQVIKLINDARRAEYTKLAQRNSIAVSDVEALAGKKAIERTSSGHYILLEGKWVKKH